MNKHQLLSWAYVNYIRALKKTELYQPTYNKSNYPLLRSGDVQRNSQDRVDFISESIDMTKIGSYLDVGSQLGYMVCEISQKHSVLSQGFDHDMVAVRYANAVVGFNKIAQASFWHMKLTPETVKQLPNYSMISFLNVFHHIAWHQGFEVAEKILRTLISKCEFFVFETGMPTELNMPWSESVSPMTKSPDDWIVNFLNVEGLKVVQKKKMNTHLSDVKRTLYVTKK